MPIHQLVVSMLGKVMAVFQQHTLQQPDWGRIGYKFYFNTQWNIAWDTSRVMWSRICHSLHRHAGPRHHTKLPRCSFSMKSATTRYHQYSSRLGPCKRRGDPLQKLLKSRPTDYVSPAGLSFFQPLVIKSFKLPENFRSSSISTGCDI